MNSLFRTSHPAPLWATLVVGLGCVTLVEVGSVELTGDPLQCDAGCGCGAAMECVCPPGVTCTQVCIDPWCAVACDDADCRFRSEGAGAFACLGTSTCFGTTTSGKFSCLDQSSCDFRSEGPAVATCTGDARCRFTLGPGAVVTCATAAACDVTCTGSCLVQCTGACTCSGAGCELSCAGEPPQTCAQGGLSCRNDC